MIKNSLKAYRHAQKSVYVFFIVVSTLLTFVAFQNCSPRQVQFESLSVISTSTGNGQGYDGLTSSGNGQGYDGFASPSGAYAHRKANYNCIDKNGNSIESFVNSMIFESNGNVTLTGDICSTSSNSVSLNSIEKASYNLKHLVRENIIFEKENPNSAPLAEPIVLCRSSNDNITGLDVVVRRQIKPTNKIYTAEIIFGEKAKNVADLNPYIAFNVSPIEVEFSINSNPDEAYYSFNSLKFNLNVNQVQKSDGTSKHSANLSTKIDGKLYDLNLNCNLMLTDGVLTP